MTCHFVTQAFLRLVAGRSVKLKELQLGREEKEDHERTVCGRVPTFSFFYFGSGGGGIEKGIKIIKTQLFSHPRPNY